MFKESVFLIVESPELATDEVVACLEKNGCKNFQIKKVSDTSTNYLQHPTDSPITHIISNTIEFIEYTDALNAMIPVTTSLWVFESDSARKLLSPHKYNPDPKFFMRDCYVCVADNLPAGDKEVIYGGVKAFGGNYLDVLTKFTTHLIALDLSNEKSIIASSVIDAESDSDGHKIDIKIVLPHWVDHCIMLGQKVDEYAYLLPNPSILRSLTPSTQISLIDELPAAAKKTDFFQGKTFFIASDYNLSERLNHSLHRLIENQGGKVINNFNADEVDIYIGRYRMGSNYKDACSSSRIIVANLQWFYHVIVNQSWVLPLHSNLLHYPYPIHFPLKNLNISITNYSGDARVYLSRLIELLGGTFTKTLTKENDYLIVAKPEGKKYTTAKYKWLDENNNPKIKIVNHLWLEECYANGELLDETESKYSFLGRNNDGIEFLLGKTKLNELKLNEPERNDLLEEIKSDGAEGYLDMEDEIEAHISPIKEVPASGHESNTKSQTQDAQVISSTELPASLNDEKSQKSNIVVHEDSTDVETKEPAVVEQQGQETHTRLGRSAAKKAALKLHNAMDDLNQYQQMVKSVTKMKTYMDELETNLTPSKRHKSASPSSNKKAKVIASVDLPAVMDTIAVMTGCELEITLNKTDMSKLGKLGIRILSEYSNKFEINTLIAPRILRTEKFLSSLSKVTQIIHPNYIIQLLQEIEGVDDLETQKDSILKDIKIGDYSLDKVLPVQDINLELGFKTKGNGLQKLLATDKSKGLFAGANLNLSVNLNGGIDIISKILKIHGMHDFKEVKLSANLDKKLLPFKEDNDFVLVAHKTKDTKLINAFKKLQKDNSDFHGTVVEWDWCVKSIFQMKLQDFKDFTL